eukprot:gene3899-2768_t
MDSTSISLYLHSIPQSLKVAFCVCFRKKEVEQKQNKVNNNRTKNRDLRTIGADNSETEGQYTVDEKQEMTRISPESIEREKHGEKGEMIHIFDDSGTDVLKPQVTYRELRFCLILWRSYRRRLVRLANQHRETDPLVSGSLTDGIVFNPKRRSQSSLFFLYFFVFPVPPHSVSF